MCNLNFYWVEISFDMQKMILPCALAYGELLFS